MTSALDDSLINKAAPAGSMRYFSLLYTSPEHRELVTALYVIDAEIRESAQSPNHDVAHTRLQWWRQEIDRLVNRNAQHPATRLLGAVGHVDRKTFARLHELIVAADMDLARMTFLNLRELRAYSARSGGTVQELIAELLAPAGLSDEERALANRLGIGIRQAQMLRDTRQDAYDGRVYLPLDLLEAASVRVEDLRAREIAPAVRGVLVKFCETIAPDLDVPAATGKAYLRPPIVLAALHRRLLDRIAALDYDVASQRIELGPVARPWTAWRAARRAR
jgi:phytoene synthase